MMRAMVRMVRRAHVVAAHVDRRRTSAFVVGVRHAIVCYVRAVIARNGRARQRAYTEVATATDAFAPAHLLVLTDRSALAANLVTRCVCCAFGHATCLSASGLSPRAERSTQ